MTDQTPASSGQRTPEQLTDRLRRFNPDWPDADAEMEQIVRAAEAGGTDHMKAVVETLFPNGPTPPRPTGGYRPFTPDITMEIRAYVNNRLFTARQSVDPFMFEMKFGDPDQLEHYVKYWIQQSFGQVAVADEESYRYFRDRVWIVRPTDVHDVKRCHDSQKNQAGDLWPRCLGGVILREYPQVSPIPGAGTMVRKESFLGNCTCRCHSGEKYGQPDRRIGNLAGASDFDENQLDEKGQPR